METTALVAQPDPPQTTSTLALVRPVAKPTDLLALHDEVTQIIQSNLTKGVDYDVIPGTGDNPSLMKPGAEKLNLAFGAAAEYDIIEQEAEHDREVRWTKKKKVWRNQFRGDKIFNWELEDGASLGLYRYVVRCRIVREGRVLASCIGVCSTLESKYVDRPRDCENTALKMAQKRAYVGATLHAYGLSNRFTQDVEENPEFYRKGPPQTEAPQTKAPPPAEPRKPGIYTGATDQQEIVQKILVANNVPEEFWEEIDRRLMNRPSSDLKAVIAEARVAADPPGDPEAPYADA